MPLALIAALALVAISAVFAIQNADPVSVDFLGWEWEASLALVLILTLGAGVLIGYLVGLPRTLSKGSEARRQRKRVEELEAQRSTMAEDLATVDRESDPLDNPADVRKP